MAVISKQRAVIKSPAAVSKPFPRKAATISDRKCAICSSADAVTDIHYIVPLAIVPVMAEKKEKVAEVKKKDDSLPYISPDTKKIKAKLNHIYTAEPI